MTKQIQPPNPRLAGKVKIVTIVGKPSRPPLTIQEWLDRELPEPDFIMGEFLSTTSRGLLVATTGLGKTNLGLALAIHAAAGVDFLHWKAGRRRRVLYIDGEMSIRLLRRRIADAAARLGAKPAGLHTMSAEDFELAPLNTPAGQQRIDALIAEIGGVDLIVFDSIMALLDGDPKETDAWARVVGWIKSLTKRNIGQVWVHHTGHDESRSYGDKSREWQMDFVAHLERVVRVGVDISFTIEFRKARERTPDNRADFETVKVALVDNQWIFERTDDAPKAQKEKKISPLGRKFLDALLDAIASDAAQLRDGRRCVGTEQWKSECVRRGLLDPGKDHSARTLFSRYRRELVAANRVACDGDLTWTL